MNEQENRLREAILADARSAAEGIVSKARRSAEKLKAEAAETNRKAHDAAVEAARDVASKKSGKMAAMTTMDVSRQWLERQEATIDAVLQEALADAEATEGDRREASLQALTREAMTAIGNESCRVRVGKAASSVVTADWLAAQAQEVFGAEASATYAVELDDSLPGGIVFVSEDGRKMFDNTYLRRLERMRSELRLIIVNA